MAEVGVAFVSIVPSARNFGSQLNSQVGTASAAAGTSGGKKFGGTFAAGFKGAFAGLGIAAAVGGGLRVLKSAVDEAREAQKVGAITEQRIKTMGNAANISAGQVGKLATAISNKTGIDDEAIQSGANLLLSFGKIRNEAGKGNQVFNRATQAVADLSIEFGGIDGASKALGKALNDPIKGITALGKSGVQFSESQKKTIKRMVESGNILGAQKIILGEVEKQVGGTAAASVTAGEKMRNAWNNAKESLGTALLPAIDSVQNAITTKIIPAIVKFIGFLQKNPAIIKAFAIGIAAIAAAFVIAFIAANWIVIAIGALVAALVYAYTKSETFRTVVQAVFAFIVAWVRMHITILVTIIKVGIAIIVGIWKTLKAIWPVVKAVFNAVWTVIKTVVGFIVNVVKVGVGIVLKVWATIKGIIAFVRGAFNTVRSIIRTVMEFVKKHIIDRIKDIVADFKAMPGKIKRGLGNLKDTLVSKGKDLVQGFVNGIKAAPGKIKDALLSLLPGPLKKFAGKLGLSSPSKLFKQYGEWTVEGYVQGIDRKRRTVAPAVASIADAAVGATGTGIGSRFSAGNLATAPSSAPMEFSLVGARIEMGKDGFATFVDGRIRISDQRGALQARYATP